MFKDMVIASRSYRNFDESHKISYEELYDMIDTARYIPSTVNLQGLRYKIVCDENCDKIFENLSWAGLLKGKGTPPKGSRPTAYIFILLDKSIAKELHYDEGIAAQTIMLAAVEKGYGGCIIGSINKEAVADILNINTEIYSIDLCLAIGKPDQNIIIKDISKGDNTNYYRDNDKNHIVPKIVTYDLIV